MSFIISSNINISCHSSCFSCLKFLVTDVQTSPHKKRRGRGITRMEEVFARTPDMPKSKIIINEFDQPVGTNCKEFTNVIGCLARKISVQCSDWRLVDIEKKDALWKDIKVIYGVCIQLLAVKPCAMS